MLTAGNERRRAEPFWELISDREPPRTYVKPWFNCGHRV